MKTTLLLSLGLVAGSASAHRHMARRMAQLDACQDDFSTFCDGANGSQLNSCIKTNWTSMSDECTDAIVSLKDQMGHGPPADIVAACADDKKTFCPDEEGREVRACMKSHWDELSANCTSAIKSHHHHHHHHKGGKGRGGRGHRHHHMEIPHEVMESCEANAEDYCDDKRGMRMVNCMNEKWEELDADCQDSIIEWGKQLDPESFDEAEEGDEKDIAFDAIEDNSEEDDDFGHHGHRGHPLFKLFSFVCFVVGFVTILKCCVLKCKAKCGKGGPHRARPRVARFTPVAAVSGTAPLITANPVAISGTAPGANDDDSIVVGVPVTF